MQKLPPEGPVSENPSDPVPFHDAAEARIGQQLRALYQEVESEPVPDIFLDLLEKLDRAEKAAGRKS